MRSLRTPLFLLIALLCTGCQLRLELDLDVDRDGGGTLALEVGADAELVARATEAGADPLGELAESAQGLEGWRVGDQAEESGERTVTLTRGFADPAELEALVAELTDALNAPEVALLEDLEVTVTDEQVAVTGSAGAVLQPAVREYGLTPRRAVRLLRRTEALDYRVSVTPPGEVLEENAPTAPDEAPVWTVAPGETVDFALTSTRPRRPLLLMIAAGVAALLIVALLARILVVRRRNADRRRSAERRQRPLAG